MKAPAPGKSRTEACGKIFPAIHDVIRSIGRGRIKTYGDVAQQAGVSVRTVVWALKSCPPDVPWHRVLGKGGKIVLAARSPLLGARQAHLLSQEGWAVAGWTVARKAPSRSRDDRVTTGEKPVQSHRLKVKKDRKSKVKGSKQPKSHILGWDS